jgi:hypothetical protein
MSDLLKNGAAPPAKTADNAKDVNANDDDSSSPKFGRLLLVLLGAVALIVVITFVSESLYL